jgi:hypothetical protein
VKKMGLLRVSRDGELEGLDLHEHGGSAYPELLSGVGYSAPEAETSAKAVAVVLSAPAE